MTRTARVKLELLRAAVTVLSLVEVPLWLLRNRRLFRNRVVYFFDHRAFGHTVSGLDFAARRYHPERISVVYLPNPDTNPYLLRAFDRAVDLFDLPSIAGAKTVHVDAPRAAIARLLLRVLGCRHEVVELTDVYRWKPLAPGPLYGSDATGTRRLEAVNYTGYLRLLRESGGPAPRLPEGLRDRCREAFERARPGFSDRPLATLLLREKGRGWVLDTAARTVGDQRSYRLAVRRLGERGYLVAGTGETDHDAFVDLPAFVDPRAIDLPEQLLNVFLLTECELFVGQQSGPFVLPNARDILCVLCDAFPYRLGTFRQRDLVLFKPLLEKGRRLTFTEIYRERPNLAYGYGFAGVTIGSNDEEEIAAAIEESAAIRDGSLVLTSEDERLIEEFRALVPPEMPLHWHGNRPPLATLRAHLL